MKMLYHSIVFLEIVFGLVNIIEPKFIISYPVFMGFYFILFILFLFLSLSRILSKNTILHTKKSKT